MLKYEDKCIRRSKELVTFTIHPFVCAPSTSEEVLVCFFHLEELEVWNWKCHLRNRLGINIGLEISVN